MSFRDTFALRLREAREQAKDLTAKLNFDEMAANDAYIHSEDFNVRGQPRVYEKVDRIKPSTMSALEQSQQHIQTPPEQRQGTTMDSIDEASSTASAASASLSAAFHASVSTVGSSSAWSLLDRTNNNMNKSSNNLNGLDDAPTPQEIDTATNDNPIESVPASVSTPSKAPATPLLSIVADTLQDTPPAVKSTRSDAAIHHDLPHLTNTSASYDDDDDSYTLSDDEDDDDSHHHDEEDPILAMMQSDSNYSNRSKRRRDRRKEKKSSKHNKNRFMEDLDRRMEQPANDELLHPLSAGTLEIEHGTDPPEASAPTPYFTRGPFGGAVLNMAMNNFHRIVKKTNSPQNRSGATSPTPPLARERPQKITTKAPEDDVHVTNSNSVLSVGELQELKSKSSTMHHGTSLVQLAQLLQEHRHFAFIAFTLILAVVVYFLTHKNLEDDVT